MKILLKAFAEEESRRFSIIKEFRELFTTYISTPGTVSLQNLSSKLQDNLNVLKQLTEKLNLYKDSSYAIRNHKLEILYKAFEIVGFNKEYVQEKYRSLVNAFQYGAPPHGGIAPGIDRIVMLLADEPNIREVICFPLNQQAQDLMMNAPSTVDPKAQKELGLQIKTNKK